MTSIGLRLRRKDATCQPWQGRPRAVGARCWVRGPAAGAAPATIRCDRCRGSNKRSASASCALGGTLLILTKSYFRVCLFSRSRLSGAVSVVARFARMFRRGRANSFSVTGRFGDRWGPVAGRRCAGSHAAASRRGFECVRPVRRSSQDRSKSNSQSRACRCRSPAMRPRASTRCGGDPVPVEARHAKGQQSPECRGSAESLCAAAGEDRLGRAGLRHRQPGHNALRPSRLCVVGRQRTGASAKNVDGRKADRPAKHGALVMDR